MCSHCFFLLIILFYMTCLFLLSFPLHFCSVVFSYLSLSFPFSSQSSSEDAAPQACPFGPDPCAPTTGQRSRCNRHSQPTHQTYGETCRWWIATEPCLPELCPTFYFVSGFVHSLSCYSPGSYSLLLELSLSRLRRRAHGSFQQDHLSPLFIHMQSLQARV